MNARRGLLAAAFAVAPIAALSLWSGNVVGLATPTTTTTAPPMLVQPTTTRPSTATTTTRVPTTTTRPTIPPVIVQPPTTRPPTSTPRPSTTTTRPSQPPPPTTTLAPTTAANPPTATTTPPAPVPDLFVAGIQATQVAPDDESGMPLVAERSSTWVRVAVGHAGAAGAVTVDGALLVERAGDPGDVLLAENGPASIGPGGGVFRFRLEPQHTAAGTRSLTFSLFNADGTPVDDSPANNSMTTVVEFHTARHPTLLLFVDPDLDQDMVATAVGGVAEEVLDVVPAAAVDVQLLPLPITDIGGSPTPHEPLGPLMWSAAHMADLDEPVIVGRVYNAADRLGDDLLVADVLSFAVDSSQYDYPGDFSRRFDPIDYCQALDELGVPCNPSDLGLVTDEPVPECETEAVEWAGLQLDLCVDDDSDSPVAGEELEAFSFTYQRIDLEGADVGGWMVVTGDWDGDAHTASVDWATTSDALPASLAQRLGDAVEGAVNGTAPAGVALRLVDAAGAPIVAVPAIRLTRVHVTSWSTSGGSDDPPNNETQSPHPLSDYLGAVPWVDGAVELELVSLADGTVLDSLRLDGEVSQVGAVHTETVGANRSLTVGWELEGTREPDAGQTFDVWLSNDGFETPIPVAVGVTGDEVVLKNTSHYSHTTGDDVQARVVPSGWVHPADGDHHATSEPFSVAGGPPLVSIARGARRSGRAVRPDRADGCYLPSEGFRPTRPARNPRMSGAPVPSTAFAETTSKDFPP